METAKTKTAFVLSGGGNRGVAQVGMLRALLERGIVPDVIIGTSVGALNGAVIAHNPTVEAIDHLESVWLNLDREQVFPGTVVSRMWNILRRDDHLVASTGLAELIAAASPAETFADLKIPLRVVTADLETGEECVLVRGPLAPSLLASSALPGIFPPVDLHQRTLVDGGVVNLVPISHALAGPINRVYVLDISDPISDRLIRSPLDVAMRAFAISRDQRFDLERQWVPAEIDLIVLPAPVDDRNFYDFDGAEAIIADAYERAKKTLAAHQSRRPVQTSDSTPRRGRRWWSRSNRAPTR